MELLTGNTVPITSASKLFEDGFTGIYISDDLLISQI